MLDNIHLFFVITHWSHVHTNYKISTALAVWGMWERERMMWGTWERAGGVWGTWERAGMVWGTWERVRAMWEMWGTWVIT